MIELPAKPKPNSMNPELLDRGFVQQGASALRVDRLGSRYRMQFGWPITPPEVTRTLTPRMSRAKRKGIRMYLPLLVNQGLPGTPVVNGAGQAGEALAVRGLRAGYVIKEGFWMTIVEADGTAYLHAVAEPVVANALGEATIEIEPPLRAPFADGDTIHLGRPYIEGYVAGENFGWAVESNKYTELSLTVEEYQ